MKVIFCGPRDATPDLEPWIHRAFDLCGFNITEVLVGDAKGIDAMVKEICETAGIPCTVFRADWKKHGRGAGPSRNGLMVAEADALVAVWDGQSAGTMDCIAQAQQKGIPVYIEQYEVADGF